MLTNMCSYLSNEPNLVKIVVWIFLLLTNIIVNFIEKDFGVSLKNRELGPTKQSLGFKLWIFIIYESMCVCTCIYKRLTW